MGDGVGDGDVAADVPEAQGAAEGADEQEVPAAEVVDQYKKPEEGEGGFDDAEDAGGEEAGVGALHADGLEDGGGVVVDGVDPGGVLPEEEHESQEETVLDLTIPSEHAEGLPEAQSDGGALLLDGGVDGGHFFKHVDVVVGDLADPLEVVERQFALALGHEPSRRLADEEKTNEHHPRWNQLDRKRDQPLAMTRRHGDRDAIVDPEADQATDLPAHLVQADETAADGGGRELRDVDGREVGCTAYTDPGKDTSTVDETESVPAIRTTHHSRTQDENPREDLQAHLSSEIVAGDVGAEGTEEGARLVHRDDVGTDEIRLVDGVLRPVEFFLEGVEGEGAADEGGVVADHDGAEGGDAGAVVDAPVVDGGGGGPILGQG